MFPQVPNTCCHCGESEGTLLHIFWNCWKLDTFWDEVENTFKALTGVTLNKILASYLLNDTPLCNKKIEEFPTTHCKGLYSDILEKLKPPNHSQFERSSLLVVFCNAWSYVIIWSCHILFPFCLILCYGIPWMLNQELKKNSVKKNAKKAYAIAAIAILEWNLIKNYLFVFNL